MLPPCKPLAGVADDVRTRKHFEPAIRRYIKLTTTMTARPEWEQFRDELRQVCELFVPTPTVEKPTRRRRRAA